MAVKIGSARSSYGNSSAGDQSGGKEVSTQEWYLHGKGWVVLRARDASAREKIALAMERACANDDIGYSQGSRNTLRKNVANRGFDPAGTTKKVNCDCSSLVRVCCNFAGIPVGDFTTANQCSKLMATGAFVKLAGDAHCKSSRKLLRGDILITRTKGHTAVVLEDGAGAGAEAEPQAGKQLRVSGDFVNLRKGPGAQFAAVDVLRKGEVLEAVAAEGWVPVLQDGAVRWISAKYVKAA